MMWTSKIFILFILTKFCQSFSLSRLVSPPKFDTREIKENGDDPYGGALRLNNFLATFSTKSSENFEIEQPDFCGKNSLPSGSRIVGGQNAMVGQFPWIAQISVRKQANSKFEFICGGSLITENIMVTAAHCFKLKDVRR